MTTNVFTTIPTASIPDRYARGWHCLGLASDFGREPRMLNYFGGKQVAYRGESGQLHILDAYCVHMGADLSKGCVEGDSIRCPFHAWRWGGDGVCDEIPYAKKIPAKARIRTWPTLEENNLLFVWHDAEFGDPIPEQRIPRMDMCFDENWSPWSIELMTIETNCRELIDNMADIGHFMPVHANSITTFKNISEGHRFVQEQTGGSDTLSDGQLDSKATYYGPAYMITEMQGEMGGIEIDSRLLVSHVPVTQSRFDLRFGVMVKSNPKLDRAANEAMVEEYVRLSREAFFQDVEIWQNKIMVDTPVLCDGDGPIHKLRQWYQQFYTDIGELPSNLAERREYVVLE